MTNIGFKQDELAPWAKPGHFNDPDMLEIGNGGMNEDEYRTHMSLWSILAAPLLAGNDLRVVPANIMGILTNRDVIAIDQDKAGKQGSRVWQSGEQEIWVRQLEGGDRAVAAFNRGAEPATVDMRRANLKLGRVRDLWTHQEQLIEAGAPPVTVPAHGVVLWRVK
jgi:alpha-galactosidase